MARKTDAGRCIRVAQVLRDMSAQDIADRMGTTRQQVHRWRSQPNLKIHQIEDFARVFDMSVAELLSLDKAG